MKGNKNIILGVVFLVVIVIGFIMTKESREHKLTHTASDVYYCPMHPQVISDKPGNCPICSMKLVKKEFSKNSSVPKVTQTKEKKILYWTDPMIPGYKAEGPGKSPMGMDLVPVFEEGSNKITSDNSVQGYSTISIDTQKQQLMGVRTVPVVKKTLTKTLHAYGYVAHDLELYQAQLEYIEAWRVFYAFMSRRQIKDEFRSDWRQYYVNQPAHGRWLSNDKLKAQERLIKAEYELRHMGLTDTQLEQLRRIKYGQPWVQSDLLFFEKDQPFWIYAQVLEVDLGFIAAGQKVIATIPTYGETVEGIVRSVSPVVDPTTRTSRVRIELPNYKGELSVNMYVNVDMPVELDEAFVIPREAIMDTGISKIVFVQTQDGVFEPRSIQTGFEGDDMVVVKSGLKEGETIVSSGNFLLDSESRLEGSLSGGQ